MQTALQVGELVAVVWGARTVLRALRGRVTHRQQLTQQLRLAGVGKEGLRLWKMRHEYGAARQESTKSGGGSGTGGSAADDAGLQDMSPEDALKEVQAFDDQVDNMVDAQPDSVAAGQRISPGQIFALWLQAARIVGDPEPNAMCLSTCADGLPSGRVVLLKSYDPKDGFVFFTNYESRKSDELERNPHAALTFWWPGLRRSVRVEGTVHKTNAEESDAYFAQRPRGSQLGAWASDQSRVVGSRDDMVRSMREVESRFSDEESVPRPDHWGGWCVVPRRIEFWTGQRNRLHTRWVFSRPAPSRPRATTSAGMQRSSIQSLDKAGDESDNERDDGVQDEDGPGQGPFHDEGYDSDKEAASWTVMRLQP